MTKANKRAELARIRARLGHVVDWTETNRSHCPHRTATIAAYAVFCAETLTQFDDLYFGRNITVTATSDDPYKSSAELFDDITNNDSMSVYDVADMPSDHPMAFKVGEDWARARGLPDDVTFNTVFRAVHDFYGHYATGHGFGEVGETIAWLAHRAMYSAAARPALFNETIAQSAWVYANKAAGNGLTFAAQVADTPETRHVDEEALAKAVGHAVARWRHAAA